MMLSNGKVVKLLNKKLTDSEIVKALECCIDIDIKCETCQLWTVSECTKVLHQATLDLINRLQAENENYSKNNQQMTSDILALYKALKTAKAEAYKEFAELLHCQCESIINQPHNENVRPISWKVAYEEFDEKIDNLLKEKVGEDNERTT